MWNPWEWLKWFYEAAGHKHPTISACGIILVFALLGFLVWWRLDAQYKKDHAPIATVPAQSNPPPSAPASEPTSTSALPSIAAHDTKRETHPRAITEWAKRPDGQEPKGKDETVKGNESNDKPPSRTGDINIGKNSPITGSTINTGTINYGPPKPFILTGEDQQKTRERLMAGFASLRLICIGRGCRTADSLVPAFSGTKWQIQRVIIGQYSSVTVGGDVDPVDLSVGVHLMEKEADPDAVSALKSALESIGIKYEMAPWKPIGGLPPASGIILVIGNPG
jgi:hypothetical protein